ncbi:MAG TPA: hypothetical protein VHO06_23705 [Polyangia bacterium]|nr:hypothetical protein [Polyangia bacterium]
MGSGSRNLRRALPPALVAASVLALSSAARAQPALSPPPPPPEVIPQAPQAPPEVAPPPPVPAPPAPEVVAPPPQPAPVSPEPPTIEAVPDVAPPPPRPRLSLAVGMGLTRDATGFGGGAHVIPAFVAEGGFGDGLAGVDLSATSTSASGRFPNTDEPVDRLALDAFGVLRPAARYRRDDTRYRLRVLRALAVELGLGFERDGTTMASGTRFVVHTGARVELPLARAGQGSELRLRVAVRRAFGLYTPEVTMNGQTVSVGDSFEAFGALAVVF